MTINEYQKLAKVTLKEFGNDLDRQHMRMGVLTEVGKIMDLYKRTVVYGKNFDSVNLFEEVGDTCWYIVNWANFKQVELETPILAHNVLDPNSDCITDKLWDFLENARFDNPQNLLNQWFAVCKELGLDLKDFEICLDKNIAKLEARYGDKFDSFRALNRNLQKERKILEK